MCSPSQGFYGENNLDDEITTNQSENENTKKLVEKWSKVLNSQNQNFAMLIEPMETSLYNEQMNEVEE